MSTWRDLHDALREPRGLTAAAPALRSLRDARPAPFWLDSSLAPARRPALTGAVSCDLVVVGAGFTGLWTALLAKEQDPSLDVLVLEAGAVGGQASGRNGGICMASLTHGFAQGAELFPAENDRLLALGTENLEQLGDTIRRLGIECGWEATGELEIASAPWQVDGLRELYEQARAAGIPGEWLDGEDLRAEIKSPTYCGGWWHKDSAIADPARLAWGLARACEERGVRIREGTPVTSLGRVPGGVGLRTPWADVRAHHAVLATNAFRPLLRRLRLHIVPVYDYAMMTEPLSEAQLDSIGWSRRQALSDAGYMFHYYRLTEDRRILWGGWDAFYYRGRHIRAEYEDRLDVFAKLAGHFFTTFPQLEGLSFTHRWAGVIDTCSRFCQFWGTALDGRVAYVLGYTGAGVAATRFGARVALDLAFGRRTELTELDFVRSRPLPFPPEPLLFAMIEATRRSTEHAELHGGRRNLWLRSLDRFGLGFDS
jgi:glycine/D-amino acid oxidase-like deaminating enzyme